MGALSALAAATVFALGQVQSLGPIGTSLRGGDAGEPPHVIADPAGGAWVTSPDGTDVGIHHVSTSGTVSSALALPAVLRHVQFNVIALGNGGLLATFSRMDRHHQPPDSGCCRRVVVLQRRPNGSWTAPQTLSRPGYQGAEFSAVQDGTRVVVLWTRRGAVEAASAPLGGEFGPTTEVLRTFGHPPWEGLSAAWAGLQHDGLIQVLVLADRPGPNRLVRLHLGADARLRGSSEEVAAKTVPVVLVQAVVAPNGTDEIVDDGGSDLELQEWRVGQSRLTPVRVLSPVDSSSPDIVQAPDGWLHIISQQTADFGIGGVGAQLASIDPRGRLRSITPLLSLTAGKRDDVSAITLAGAAASGGRAIALANIEYGGALGPNWFGPLASWSATAGRPAVYAGALAPPAPYYMSVAALTARSYEVAWSGADGYVRAARIVSR